MKSREWKNQVKRFSVDAVKVWENVDHNLGEGPIRMNATRKQNHFITRDTDPRSVG